jgi:hypothetical protein
MMKGWHVVEFFIDAGVSGSVRFADRPEGKRLLETAGKGDVIVTASSIALSATQLMRLLPSRS